MGKIEGGGDARAQVHKNIHYGTFNYTQTRGQTKKLEAGLWVLT